MSGDVTERERSGERTKLAAQISLKGDIYYCNSVMLYKLYFAPCQKSTINGDSNFNRPILFLNSEFRCPCLNS